MKVQSIGNYVDPVTTKVYEVNKRTKLIPFAPLDGPPVTVEGGVDYITTSGINLNPKSDDESVFEMVEIDGILHRQ